MSLVPWTNKTEIVTYLVTKHGQAFTENDPRCHTFIFRLECVSIVVTMKFTGGDNPIDLRKVAEVDENAHPLKRLPHHETLALSESMSRKPRKVIP